MNYNSFSREQIESALKAVKLENADLQNIITKLKKEIKSLKLQCTAFESDNLSKKNVARRQTIY